MKREKRLGFFLSHVSLIGLSILFSMPFIWMVSTSVKDDDELIHDPMVWFPELPNMVNESPYLDYESHPPRWRQPVFFPDERDWNEFVTSLRGAIRKRAQEIFLSPTWPEPKDPIEPAWFQKAAKDIEDSIWQAVKTRIPDSDWARENAVALFVNRIQTEDVVKAWRRAYRTLALGEIHLRNAHAVDIGASPQPPRNRIPYVIQNREKPIELASVEIPIASPEEPLDQIMVRFQGDASYHRLSMKLEYHGKVFQTEKPAFLTIGEYQDIFWKFTPQMQYDIDHLTLIEDSASRTDIDGGKARVTLSLIPTPYDLVLWERLMKRYMEVFRWVPYATYTWVSIKITSLNIFGQLLACSLVAFAFARLSFPGRNSLFVLMLATMMLPPQVTMIPQFMLFSWMGAYNTLFPLTIMAFTGAPFFIFLLRQFYMSIPTDLTDAAKIDGCGYFTIYWRIMLPLVKPALAAIAIFQFQNSWNEFLQPLIYITDHDKTPISVGLFMFRQAQGGQWSELMAASSMMTLPIILLFFFTQRYFIQGVTLTGLKG